MASLMAKVRSGICDAVARGFTVRVEPGRDCAETVRCRSRHKVAVPPPILERRLVCRVGWPVLSHDGDPRA